MILAKHQPALQITRPRVRVSYRQRLLRLPARVLELIDIDTVRVEHGHVCRIAVDDCDIEYAIRLRPEQRLVNDDRRRIVSRRLGFRSWEGNHDDGGFIGALVNFCDPDVVLQAFGERDFHDRSSLLRIHEAHTVVREFGQKPTANFISLCASKRRAMDKINEGCSRYGYRGNYYRQLP